VHADDRDSWFDVKDLGFVGQRRPGGDLVPDVV